MRLAQVAGFTFCVSKPQYHRGEPTRAQAKVGPRPVVVNKVLFETQPHKHLFMLSLAAFVLKWQLSSYCASLCRIGFLTLKLPVK